MATARRISSRLEALVRRPPPPAAFSAALVNGHWRSPRISLRRQADMRKAALQLGLDAQRDVGLPPLPEHGVLRRKPPKGTRAERTRPEREAARAAALAGMAARVAAWRTTQREAKAAARPRLPF